MYSYQECFMILVDWNCILFFTGPVQRLQGNIHLEKLYRVKHIWVDNRNTKLFLLFKSIMEFCFIVDLQGHLMNSC